ncbi:MAG: hypothetical protein JRN08_03540 [Nitrososphaerota archaeon]|nr:hypothetical protein [Nitrososphaerota archaeon]
MKLGQAVTVSLMLLLFVSLQGGSQIASSLVILHPEGGGHGILSNDSLTWSGYAVLAPQGSVTNVSGSWVVPSVQSCGQTLSGVSLWVGMDGYNSSTVEQVGTDSYCYHGAASYYAWSEVYPSPSVTNPTIKVNPGDVVFGEVSYSDRRFNLTLVDLRSGESLSRVLPVSTAQRGSAEWVVEDPSTTSGPMQLANFGSAYFGNDLTGMKMPAMATISGHTGPVGSFGGSLIAINMVTQSMAALASPTPISMDGTSFAVDQAGH